jgi:transposase InsO family protein
VGRRKQFKGRQFADEVILWAVRWNLMFPISYRDLELMLLDRGVEVDHTTIFRWIQAYAAELEKRIRPHLRTSNGRGSQYCSVEYQAELRKNGISISMSGNGNCFDNAMVETFFKTLKAELVWRTLFQSRIEAASAIGRYIDGFYNPVRRHSALDFISPLQFERRAA